MKTRLITVSSGDNTYDALMFICPGCRAGGPSGYEGLYMLPVNNEGDIGKPSWTWNGDLDKPTLSPSILSQGYSGVCHSFLEDGVFRFLPDSEHPLVGQSVPIPDLPDWAEELSEDDGEDNGSN